MDPKDFYEEMLKIQEAYSGDSEAVHTEMDEPMCMVLKDLGYEKGVEVFENTEKWYA